MKRSSETAGGGATADKRPRAIPTDNVVTFYIAVMSRSSLRWVMAAGDAHTNPGHLQTSSSREKACLLEAQLSTTSSRETDSSANTMNASEATRTGLPFILKRPESEDVRVKQDTRDSSLILTKDTDANFEEITFWLSDRGIHTPWFLSSDKGTMMPDVKTGRLRLTRRGEPNYHPCEIMLEFASINLKSTLASQESAEIRRMTILDGLVCNDSTVLRKGYRGEVHIPSASQQGYSSSTAVKCQPLDDRTLYEIWAHRQIDRTAFQMGLQKTCCSLFKTLWDDKTCVALLRKHGPSLESLLKTSGSRKSHKYKRLSIPSGLSICKQVLMALSVVHSSSFIYMDLQPGNILLGTPASLIEDSDLTVVLTDFGSCQKGQKNSSGEIIYEGPTRGGKYDLMPSEQFTDRGTFSFSVDTFCVGSLLYTFIVGYPPFAPEEGNKLSKENTLSHPHRGEEGISILKRNLQSRRDPSVPDDLVNIVVRALQPNPSDRYANVKEFLVDLGKVHA